MKEYTPFLNMLRPTVRLTGLVLLLAMATIFLANDNAELAKALEISQSEKASCLALDRSKTSSPDAAVEVSINEPQAGQKQPEATSLPTRHVKPPSRLVDVDQGDAKKLSPVQKNALRDVLQTLHQASQERSTPLESDVSPFGTGSWPPVKP